MDFRRTFIVLGIFALLSSAVALARPAVSLHLAAYVVQGNSQQPLDPHTPVTAGERVRFVIEAHNGGTSNALHFAASDPIPPHMTYVPGSARDGHSTVEFSLDGKTFSPRPTVRVRSGKGYVTKAADVTMYRAIRWVTHVPLAPNRTFTYSYEAQVNGLKKGAK